MPDDVRSRILQEARARFGIEYRLDPPPDGVNNLDCSLFVLKVFEAADIPITGVRTAEQIRQACDPIDFADVQPGDLLFFEHTYDAAGPAGPDGRIASHIGISLGAGSKRMLDANDSKGTGETNIGTVYWQDHLFEARRPPGLAANAPTNTLRGIDVASHQGAVNWPAVASAGIAFGFTKATGGTWYRNPTCAPNWFGMKAAGIQRGAYHYAFETSGQPFPGDGPEAEADYFLAELKRAGGIEAGDLLALDIEDGNGPLGEWVLRWCKRVEAVAGFKPFVYTGAWFSVPHGFGSVPALRDYPLWLASYTASMPAPPPPWSAISIWQHSASGQVPGVTGDCDLNQFFGTQEQLLALGKPGAVVPPVWSLPNPDVGSGILALMTEDGTTPASHSTFLPLGRSPALIEEAYGLNGCRYAWHLPTNRSWRYPAA